MPLDYDRAHNDTFLTRRVAVPTPRIEGRMVERFVYTAPDGVTYGAHGTVVNGWEVAPDQKPDVCKVAVHRAMTALREAFFSK
jgi:hypothetical protein